MGNGIDPTATAEDLAFHRECAWKDYVAKYGTPGSRKAFAVWRALDKSLAQLKGEQPTNRDVAKNKARAENSKLSLKAS